jgi:tRNA nucleotidyltransferase (CCA-adding enzyme)
MPLPADLVQTEPGLAVLRMAALLAEDDGALDEELLDAMAEHTVRGALRATPAAALWPELQRGLMARAPSRMLAALRLSGALGAVLPEVAALFGVPQLGADQTSVDIGLHTLNALADARRCEAPLDVRFALLVMNVGKSDSPPEHLPIHYRHVERGGPRIKAICARFGVPAACRELALLALTECERVHRVSEVRAGPVAAMLERLGAFGRPERFEALMQVCACDYRAHGEGFGPVYPKAELLYTALRACREVASDADDLDLARAQAIAAALGSQRWSAAGNV